MDGHHNQQTTTSELNDTTCSAVRPHMFNEIK